MRQPRKVSVFPPKPELLQIYGIHALGIKALTCFAGGTGKLNISLSKRGRFPVKQMEAITDGAGPGYYRSSRGWGEVARGELVLVLHLTLVYPTGFISIGFLSFRGWAGHAVCLWVLQEFSKHSSLASLSPLLDRYVTQLHQVPWEFSDDG